MFCGILLGYFLFLLSNNKKKKSLKIITLLEMLLIDCSIFICFDQHVLRQILFLTIQKLKICYIYRH